MLVCLGWVQEYIRIEVNTSQTSLVSTERGFVVRIMTYNLFVKYIVQYDLKIYNEAVLNSFDTCH